MDSRLPSTDPTSTRLTFAELSGELQARIDRACDELESAWQAVATRADPNTAPPGGWPVLSTLIAALPDVEKRVALRELIPIDISYRRRCGAPIVLADYRQLAELDADWLSQIEQHSEGETRRIEAVIEAPFQDAPRTSLAIPSLELYRERLVAGRLLDGEEVDRELAALPDEQRTTDELGQRLIALGLLTPFQHASLLSSPPLRLVLGDYVILSPLGQGGMGTVYRARHRRLDRIVALKVLPPQTAGNANAANRFRREIRALARLSHPRIVTAHDAGEDDGVTYLVMECIDGLDLSTWVRRHGPLSIADAVECAAQAADGLAYAHQQGIIHRDIKPSNLLVSREESRESRVGSPEPGDEQHGSDSELSTLNARLSLKVLDLGLARFESETPAAEATAVTRSGMIFGTAEYMSPEQAVNVRLADQRSDIYSLGCTLFYLLTGRPVVRGETYMEMVLAHQLLTLPLLSAVRKDVPLELDDLFRRMTARKPEERIGSMREVHDALRAIPLGRLTDDAPALDEPLPWVPSDELTVPETSRRGEEVAIETPANRTSAQPRQSLRLGTRSAISFCRRRPLLVALVSLTLLLLCVLAISPWLVDGPIHSPHANREPLPQPLVCPADGPAVESAQRAWAAHLNVASPRQNTLGMTLVLIPPGEFTRGTSDDELNRLAPLIGNDDEVATVQRSETPAHRVRLTRPFWIGQTEVTVAQFQKFVAATGHVTRAEKAAGWGVRDNQWVFENGYSWKATSEQVLTPDHPASNLTHFDALAFCQWLSVEESREHTSVVYRLPTEAEWEYACRAGSATLWPFSDDPARLPDHALTFANSNNRLSAVAQKRPNAFGLFDMLGNESEWCSDWFAPYSRETDPLSDPTGPAAAPIDSAHRVQRGGSFNFPPHRQRPAAREGHDPNLPQHGGFRIVREQ
jgi:serine/threonine-protein kinase